MKGPLSPDMYATGRWPDTWWRASAPAWADPPALSGDIQAEVAIIGGGFAGLATAIRLAERDIEAVVLDAAPIGWGASGRNGGIAGLASHKLSARGMARRYGADEVARYTASQVEGLARLRAFCTEHGVPVQGDGELLLAHSRRALDALNAERPDVGITHDPVPPGQPNDMSRLGGIRIRPSFGVHPLRLVRALADHARGLGARVYPQSEVIDWARNGGTHLLHTTTGQVRARQVVLATNGFTPDGLHPRFDGRAVPVISNIGVTRVLTADERARHPWLGDDMIADTRNLLVYLRLLPEGRLLFGMRGDLSGADANTAGMRQAVARRMAQQFPGWAGIAFDYFWRGPICATASYTPSVGTLSDDPSVHHAFGWHGSGVNGAQVAGRLLADVIAGADQTHIPAPYRGLAPRLPMPRLRPAYVAAALCQQRIADILG